MKNLPNCKRLLMTLPIVFFAMAIVALLVDGLVFKFYIPQFVDSTMTVFLDARYDLTKVFNTTRLESPPPPVEPKTYLSSTDLRAPPGRSVKYFRYESVEYTAALKELGFGRAEDHEFKSKYIVTPLLYENNLVMKAPGIRKTKLISLHRAYIHNKWLIIQKKYNRDFKRCPYSECELDLSGKMTQQADLVIFLCKGLVNQPQRSPGQLWAFGCWEPSSYWNYPNYPIWKDAFNVTIHHKLDADIVFTDVLLAWRHKSLLLKEKDYLAFAKEKTKTAVWWVSNCRKDRLNFVKEMRKYIDIDIGGRCGTFKCPRNDETACRQMLNTTYKFYLGFENSFCQDYVTDKIGRNFEQRVHVIPVVKGAIEYEKHFPPGAYVNANKFKSAKELALYLKELGNDLPRYAKMLQEADKLVGIPKNDHIDWCKVCEDLHTRKFGVHKDIKDWSHTNKCTKSEYYST